MHSLVIRHVDGSDPARFQVVRLADAKSTDGAVVASPLGFGVEGRPDSDLVRELRWYLESFLDYPFPPETDHAERVLQALASWGEQAFGVLFGSMQGRDWFKAATAAGVDQLHLQVSSDDPKILAWPWEALRDPETDFLALGGQIERKLNHVDDPIPLSDRLPRDRVNILLVTARPYEADVRFRSISRPLVELIEKHRLPAQVRVLRPPTLDRLREHLRERPDHYHILHFDGHGGYGEIAAGGAGPYALQGAQGRLVFESEDGQPDPIAAEQLSVLLREHRIPAVVLNACQSGMVDERAEDAFASVAASLVKAGIRSVVAMGYSLYVSGAERFLPAFYRGLFEAHDVTRATRRGRQEMYQHAGRVCARGTFPLQDWLVPVVYQQEAMDFSFAAGAGQAPPTEEAPELPEEVRDEENPHGFVGRDGALLAMERAMRRRPAGILIHGLGGVGKTTLARGFVRWLQQTEGLGHGCFWFTFNDVRSAEFVFNRLGEALFGADFIPTPMAQKLEALAEEFKANRFVLVWDNFESACGIEGTPAEAMLSPADQALLKGFLAKLRGGASKVILTSRSDEDWLGQTNRFKLDLGGLQHEERWEYCEVILRDLGLTIDRDDPELVRLMDALDGHPLMMRALLPKLGESEWTARKLTAALQTNLAELGLQGDATQEKLLATLRLVERSFPEELRPLLVPLGLHERFVDADHLEQMAQQVDAGWTRGRIDRFLAGLCAAGLVRDRGQAICELHPALTGFLRSRPGEPADPSRDPWTREFVDLMGTLAQALTGRPLHEQRFSFHIHEANFRFALGEAERLDMGTDFGALVQGLAAHALNVRSYKSAEDLFRRLAEFHAVRGELSERAAPLHQLGRVAQEQGDLGTAKEWYLKSLAITEKLDNEPGAARTYHQLGIVAQEQRNFDAAEKWYLKSLAIKEKLDNEPGAARTYHQLGIVAGKRGDYDTAEKWYLKSLATEEKLDNEPGAASSYHQLGIVAQERGDFDAAEKWYLKSLAIEEKLGDEHSAAGTYHQLGNVAYLQRDFDTAKEWYLKSLASMEKLGDEQSAAGTYHQLGIVAREQGDQYAAEEWSLKALAIFERLRIEHSAARTYAQLGILADMRTRYEEAGSWLIKSIATFARQRDSAAAQRSIENFMMVYRRATQPQQAQLREMWDKAEIGPFPGPDGT